MAGDRPRVAVAGSADADAGTCALAEEVGAELARRGAVVVTGGLGGVMEAACRGAKAWGGDTIGILPSDDAAHANPWVDVALATGLGEARNALVVANADAVVAVAGGFGTLSEIALALRRGTPVVGLGTWELALAGRPVGAVHVAATAAEAAAQAVELASYRTGRRPG